MKPHALTAASLFILATTALAQTDAKDSDIPKAIPVKPQPQEDDATEQKKLEVQFAQSQKMHQLVQPRRRPRAGLAGAARAS